MPRKLDNSPATLRAISVLEAVVAADRPVSLLETATAVQLPKPTVHRLLLQLQRAGILVREPGSRRYVVGGRLARLGRQVMLHSTLRSARRAALERLVTEIGESCNLTMLDENKVIYLDRVESAWPLRVHFQSGSRVPLHCTASGKLLLALAPKPRRDRMLSGITLDRHTPHTITDKARLESELAGIRRERYSTDKEEYMAGLVCVAVPISDVCGRASAALAIHAPAARMPLASALGYLPVLRRAAEDIARSLDN